MLLDSLQLIGTLLLVVGVALFMIVKLYKYKKLVDEKNMQLIQFYLDAKFFSKSLTSSLNMSDSEEFCRNMTKWIKEYYNLEDLIVIDSINMFKSEDNTGALRCDVLNFIQENLTKITKNLNGHKLIKMSVNAKGNARAVYVTRLIAVSDRVTGMIVCIENKPSLLNKHEKFSLENSINLLKTRIIGISS